MKIMIVDDQIEIVNILSELLGDQYEDVRYAPRIDAALAMMDEFVPDILITDFNMPEMNGKDLSDLAHSKYGCDCIILTGDVEVAYDEPHVKTAYKPINFRKLLNILSEYEETRTDLSMGENDEE